MKKFIPLFAILSLSACEAQHVDVEANGRKTVRGYEITDTTGRHLFDVDVVLPRGATVDEGQWLLDNLEIVPFEQAFPDMERPQREDDDTLIDPEGEAIEVRLYSLDPEIDADDFAWRIVREQATTPADTSGSIGSLRQSVVNLSRGRSWYARQYRCYVYSFTPMVTGSGVSAVDQGKRGKAGTSAVPFFGFVYAPAPVARGGWSRAYYRGRVTASYGGVTVHGHTINCW